MYYFLLMNTSFSLLDLYISKNDDIIIDVNINHQ